MSLNILDNINQELPLKRLQGTSYERVKHAFFANYAAALLLMKAQNLPGLMEINDPEHAELTKFSDRMSDLNF